MVIAASRTRPPRDLRRTGVLGRSRRLPTRSTGSRPGHLASRHVRRTGRERSGAPTDHVTRGPTSECETERSPDNRLKNTCYEGWHFGCTVSSVAVSKTADEPSKGAGSMLKTRTAASARLTAWQGVCAAVIAATLGIATMSNTGAVEASVDQSPRQPSPTSPLSRQT